MAGEDPGKRSKWNRLRAIDGVDGDAAHDDVSADDLTSGVEIGDVAQGASREVTIELLPSRAETFEIEPAWSSYFVLCAGDDATELETLADEVTLQARATDDARPRMRTRRTRDRTAPRPAQPMRARTPRALRRA